MLSPVNKASAAQAWAQTGVIDPYDLQHAIRTQVGALIGAQDNPHFMRVRRQIDLWLEGPPPAPASPEPTGDPQADEQALAQFEQAGMMYQQQTTELAARIFERRPNELEPQIAMMRAAELSRVMSSTKYGKFPLEWRTPFDMEYQQMSLAAMPPAPSPTDPNNPNAPPGEDAGAPTAGGGAAPPMQQAA